jgi:hypothetical protein
LDSSIQEIHFSFIGYKPKYIRWSHKNKERITIPLAPENFLEPIHITAKGDIANPLLNFGITRLGKSDMAFNVGVAGEQDVYQSLQKIPGVTSGPEGVGGISIRGSLPDQNLFLLDGVPVFYPSHTLGMLSFLPGSAIKSIDCYKNTIPARFTGRTGAVIDVKINDGNAEKHGLTAELSPVSAKCSVNGPISKNVTYFLSGRRSIIDPWIQSLSTYINQEILRKGQTQYLFYDVIGLFFNREK